MKDDHQKSILLRSEEFEALKLSCDKRAKYFEELIRYNEIGEEKLNLKIKELQDRLGQKEKITAENLSLNNRFKDSECQIEKLTIENSKLKVENRKRTCQKLSFMEEKIDRLIEYEIENTKLKTKLHESERTAFQKTEIEKENHQSTIKNYKDEIYRLEKEILRINMELNEKFDEIRNSKDMIIQMNFELAFKNEEIFKLEEKINSLYTDIENSDILRKEKEATFNQLKIEFDEIQTKLLAFLSLSQKYLKLSEEAKRFNFRINKDEKETQEISILKRELLELKKSFNIPENIHSNVTQQSSVKKRAQVNIYTSNSDKSDNDTESKIGNDSIMSDYYESDVNPVCAPKTSKVAFADSKIYSKFSKRNFESLTSTIDSESDDKSKKSPRIKQNVSNNSFNGDGPHVGR
ncbi:hypothetical protein BpHYR1_034738 [Brachionus plicatilis]|uniref:Uncharacterized protein n=1 Tax=Brachionus plicatilis TaxID=10195 RepID=A0A3M7SAT8_BRAPC|nr:hypothetical protein BpHYR1_034738 [Brachionus plicatilis]